MITNIYIGEDKIDLFKDENIEVVDSVVDINDITKNTSSFTKTFTVPSSDENNKIFKHYYDANIDNTFDARTKVAGRIELDGMFFKQGKFTLEKVNVKQGAPTAYTIRFTGNLVDIKTKVKKDELSKLDLSAFDHSYDSRTIMTGLTTSLSSGDIVYPMFAKKQYYYNADGVDNTQSETVANIAWGAGVDAGVVWSDLRPAIRLIKIIEAIETDYNITFSRDFFGTTEFTGLFMWLNNSSEREIVGNRLKVLFDSGSSTYVPLPGNIGTFPLSSMSGSYIYFKLELQVTPAVGSTTIPYTILMYRDGEVIRETTHTGADTQNTNIYAESGTSEQAVVYYEIRTDVAFTFTTRLRQREQIPLTGTINIDDTYSSSQTNAISFVISDNIPKITILDFLKGIFSMFKLVVVPQNDGSLYVNTLNSYYADGSEHDLTRYVSFENIEVERGKILNEISLKFQEPTTLLNLQFKENTLASFGDEEVVLNDENGELLDGDSLSFELPFEQIVYERLQKLGINSFTGVQYGAIIDAELAPVNPKPHIFYNINNDLNSSDVAFIDQAGAQSQITSLNIPSHGNTLIDPTYSTVFGKEFDEYWGMLITNTLYARHYDNYILSIFDIKKRTFKFKAFLPIGTILKLKLNDVIKIKDNFYRPDKNTYNINTGEVGLQLVNSFNNEVNQFTTNTSTISKDNTAETVTLSVNNSLGATTLKVTAGFGTSWITVSTLSTTPNSFGLAFLVNSTGADRSMFLTLTQTVTGKTIEVLLIQTE